MLALQPHQGDVGTFAHHPQFSKRYGVVFFGDLIAHHPIAPQGLEIDDRIGIADRFQEQAFCIVGISRHDHFESSALGELRLHRVAMELRGTHITAEGRADGHLGWLGPSSAKTRPGKLLAELMKRVLGEAEKTGSRPPESVRRWRGRTMRR